MRNLYASAFVVVFLAACATHSYKNTHHAKQELMPTYPASSWDAYVKRGGAFE